MTMFLDKSGRVCLATLEYAFAETPSLTTHCPSCGLRLIIRHEHFVNRVTSLGLIIGISALIGYHLGANRHLIKRFCRKLLQLFNLDDSTSSNENPNNNPNNSRLNVRKVFTLSGQLDCLNGSDRNDSSMDIYWPNYEDELYEIMACNQYSNNNDDDDLIFLDRFDLHQPQQKNIRSKTVDKIDQVLHQIDDIKKSIVEIDGELYHVTGSKYASFNPDFLTLTDYGLEEFDDNHPNRNHNHNNYRLSPTLSRREESVRPISPAKFESKSNLYVEFVAPSPGLYSNEDSNLFPYEKPRHERRISMMSFGSSENLPLEWDESECNYFSFHPYEQSDNHRTTRSLSTEPPIPKGKIETGTGMTDEQKLKNMPELLEEAKHLGLLNNIFDACLQQPPTINKIQAKGTGSASREEAED